MFCCQKNIAMILLHCLEPLQHPSNIIGVRNEHFNAVQRRVKLGKKLLSQAKHFANQSHDTNLSPANQGGGMICSIVWQNNPISVVKTFPTKNIHCVPKCELQFLNNPDPTHNFLSTPTTKSVMPVNTDPISMGVQSRPPPPALMGQSMRTESAQHTKLPQIGPDAMFAYKQLMSDWKHCEDFQSTDLRNNSNNLL